MELEPRRRPPIIIDIVFAIALARGRPRGCGWRFHVQLWQEKEGEREGVEEG